MGIIVAVVVVVVVVDGAVVKFVAEEVKGGNRLVRAGEEEEVEVEVVVVHSGFGRFREDGWRGDGAVGARCGMGGLGGGANTEEK